LAGTVEKRGRGGAPRANGNALKSGLSSLAKTGRVPTKLKGGRYIGRQIRKLNREAIAEFIATHDREPALHEHIVLKVMARAEARAMLHERMLAVDWDALSHEQRTASLAAIGGAGDQLIRCSRELGLDQREARTALPPPAWDEHLTAADATTDAAGRNTGTTPPEA
jgi:hypothetical protein